MKHPPIPEFCNLFKFAGGVYFLEVEPLFLNLNNKLSKAQKTTVSAIARCAYYDKGFEYRYKAQDVEDDGAVEQLSKAWKECFYRAKLWRVWGEEKNEQL